MRKKGWIKIDHEMGGNLRGVFDSTEIDKILKTGFLKFVNSEEFMNKSPEEFWVDGYERELRWMILQRNLLVELLENALSRVLGPAENAAFPERIDIIGEKDGDGYLAVTELEKEFLSFLLNPDAEVLVKWEDLDAYELVLTARPRTPAVDEELETQIKEIKAAYDGKTKDEQLGQLHKDFKKAIDAIRNAREERKH